MSLVGNLWNRLRGSAVQRKRARRMFFEPLEGRQLLAAMLELTKTDNFANAMPQPLPVAAGETSLIYSVTLRNSALDDGTSGNDATTVQFSDTIPAHTKFKSATLGPGTPNGVTLQQPPAESTGLPVQASLDTLKPGESIVVIVTVSVDSNA